MMLNGFVFAQVSLPYAYDFDASNTLTEGWQSEFENPSFLTVQVTGVRSSNQGAFVYSAPNAWVFSTIMQWEGGYNQYLISPRFVNATADSVQVRFKYRVADETVLDEKFRVGYTTADSYSSTEDFTWRTGIVEAHSEEWQTFMVNLPADAQYMIIHYCPDTAAEGICIDNILIRPDSPAGEHTIYVSANAGGTVSPSVSVADGDDYILTVTAEQGHYIASVLLDGQALSQAAYQTSFSYLLTGVVSDHTFVVTFAEREYSIHVSVGEHGRVIPDGGVMSQVIVPWGHDTTFYFIGDEGYHVEDVVVDNYWHGGAISSYTFFNVTANHTISVSFTLNDYVITASAGVGGSISPSGEVGVTGMTNQSFTITPDAGYLIDTVYVDNEPVMGFNPSGWSYTFYEVSAPHTISAVFAPQQYEVTFAHSAGGTIAVTGGDSINEYTRRVYYADVLEFSFLPDEGYQLSDLQVNGISVEVQNPYQLTHVLQNSTLYAAFAEQTYSVTVVQHGSGTVTPMSVVDSGYFSASSFIFSPSSCSQLDSLLLDGGRIATENPCMLTHLVGNHQLDVYFGEVYYTMTAEPAEHGTLTAPQQVACSGNAVFTLKADPCYGIDHFYLDGVQHDEYLQGVTSDSLIAIVPNCMAEHTASATFIQQSYAVEVTSTGAGTISHLGSQQVPCGSQLSFTAVPDECSYVSLLLIDEVDVTESVEHHPCLQAGFGDTLLFTLDNIVDAHTVQVVFSTLLYDLTTQVVGEGMVSPLGLSSVQCSENQSVEIHPSACSQIRGVWVDGVEVTGQLDYVNGVAFFTFTDVRAEHSLLAEFEGMDFTISLQNGEHGRMLPSGDSVVACGDELQMTIVPDECYYADTVWIDGVVSTDLMQHRVNANPQIGDTLFYTFSNINVDHTIITHFAPITYSVTTMAEDGGQISGTVLSGTANCGDALTFTITPDECYRVEQIVYNGLDFSDYQIDENGVATVYIASLTSSVSLMARFERRNYLVVMDVPQHGMLWYPTGAIECGSDVRVTFVADDCYHLDSAYVNGVWYLPSQLSYEDETPCFDILNMHDYAHVTAHFSADSVHFVTSGNSPISVSDTMLACGQTMTCYSVIPDCQEFDSVRMNGVAMTESVFNMVGSVTRNGDTLFFTIPFLTEDCEFSVFYSPHQYQLSVNSVGHGSVEWPSEQLVNCGDSIAIAIHPDDCFELIRVLNYGVEWEMDNDTLLIVSAVHSNYNWEFQFDKRKYAAVIVSSENGNIEGQTENLICGGNYEYAFHPSACGQLDSVWLDGQCVNDQLDTIGQNIMLRVENVRVDFTVEARFVPIFYHVEVRNTEHVVLQSPVVGMVECDSMYVLRFEVDDCYYLADFLVNGESSFGNLTIVDNQCVYTMPSVHSDLVLELAYGLDRYTVRRQVRENGNILEDVVSEVECGSDTTLSAMWSDDCYSVRRVMCNGVDTTVLDTYSFENIHHFVFLQLEIARDIYQIDVQDVEHCQINAGNENNRFSCGENVNFLITTDEGYYVAGIIVDGDTLAADDHYEFESIHANHSLSAVVGMISYTLQCHVIGGEGEVMPADTVIWYGKTVEVELLPSECQHVDSVWVNGEYVGSDRTYSLVIFQNTNVDVKFATDTNYVQVLCNGQGHVSCDTNNAMACGQDFSFTIIPDVCSRISSVSLDGVEHLQDVVMAGAEGVFSLSGVMADHIVKVAFENITYPVEATFGEGGTVYPPFVQCSCSGDVLMDIKPEECYHIDSVFVNGVYVGNPAQYHFNYVTGDSTLHAVFARDLFKVVAVQNEGGTMTPVDTSWVGCGDNITYVITSDAGHFVSGLTIDGVPQAPANSYTFVNVTSDHTIEVMFEVYKYDFVVTAGSGGTIQPSSEVWVSWGEQQHFDILPDNCYHIDSVFVDDVYYGNISEYTFTHVTAPHEISATFARNMETITASAGEGGSIAPSGAVQLLCGDNQAFTIQPDECHYLSDILVNGVSVGANDTYTFENVEENQTIEAVFGTLVKQVGLNIVGDGGSLLPDGDAAVNCGDDLAVTITPAPCHIIQSILVNGEEWTDFNPAGDVYTFSNIRGDSSLTATFTMDMDTITVTANNAHGTVSSPGENVLECGSDFSVAFTPDDCYRVGSVRVDGVIQSSSSLQTIGDSKVLVLNDVVENHLVSVNFNQLDYLLIARTDGGGTISPMGAFPVCGSSMTFTVEPVNCYAVDSVFVNGVYLPSSNLTFDGDIATFELTDIREDINIYVKFRGLHYQLNVSNNGDGEVMLSQGGVDCDGDLTFSILPSACERIEQVLLNGEDITAALDYRQNVVSWLPDTAVYVITNVQDNQDLVINYQSVADKQIVVNYYEGAELMAQDVMNVRCGSDTSLLLAYECYSITDLEVDGNPVSLDYQDDTAAVYFFHQILTDHALSATFERNSYSIVATAGEGGSITPADTTEVLCGGSQSYTITPEEGYYIATLAVDNAPVTVQDSWTFSDVRSNHTIAVTFSRYSYSVTTAAGEGGSVTPAGISTVLHGDDLVVTITPDGCYYIDSVFVDSVYSGADSSYSFSNVTGNHTLSATFARNSYSITASAGEGGSISPNGTTEVLCGGSQSYIITPEEGCYIASLTVDHALVTVQGSWTFSDVRGDHTIEVTFSRYSYNVTTAAGEGGSVAPAGISTVLHGDDLAVTITSDDCYHIDSVFIDGVYSGAIEDYTFSNVTGNHTLSATFARDSYTITATAGEGGGITPAGATEVLCSGSQNYTFTPDDCYHIDSVFIDGVYSGAISSYTFSDINENHNVSATFARDSYTITATAGEGGSITPAGESEVLCGDSQSYTITPDDCFAIASIIVDGEEVSEIAESYVFANVVENHTIDVTFSQIEYVLSSSVYLDGEEVLADMGSALCGEMAEVEIPLFECFHMDSMRVNGEWVDPVEIYFIENVRMDYVVEAFISDDIFYVESFVQDNGTISPSDTMVFCTSDVSVTITPEDCYHIDSVFIDGVYSGAISSYTFSDINENHNVSATFARDSYTITATDGEGGIITPAGETEVLCGDSQNYTITPDEGYYIATLTVDGEAVAVQDSWTFSDVRGDHAIAVTFGHYSYTITTTAGEGGSVSPAGSSSVEYGENLTVNITADGCYHIDSVFIDGSYAGAITSYTFSNITADHSLLATFARDSYTITATAGEGGGITPVGATEVLCGDDQSYTITPEEGYYIAALTVDGEAVAVQDSWTFSDVRGDHTIAVTFGHYSYTITTTAGEGGSVSPADTTNVEYGESLTVNITADDCYHIDSVFIDGSYAGAITSYTFDNVTENHAIAATFLPVEYTLSFAVYLEGEVVLTDTSSMPCGEMAEVEIPLFDCYHIDSLRVNGEWIQPVDMYIIDEMRTDYEVEAYLYADQFYVAASVQGSGTVAPADTVWGACTEDVTVIFVPETGWHVEEIIVDGESLGEPDDNSYTFQYISENHTIEVIFALNQYAITSSVEPINAGQITPYGTQYYNYGESVTYYITPFPNYRIVRVEVDGEDVGDADNYTFTFVDADHSIVAYFETTGIDEVETSPMDIRVLNGELQVESTGHGQILSVEVFDLAGRCVVRHGAAGTVLQLPLPVATGVYVVRVVTTEAIESRKVSVNRW